MSIIEQVIKQSGGIGALSKALRISPQAIHKWRKKGGVPLDRVIEVEKLSGVPREQLRPELFRSLSTASRKRA